MRDSEEVRDMLVGEDEDMQRVIAHLTEIYPEAAPYEDFAALSLSDASRALLALLSRGFVDPRLPV